MQLLDMTLDVMRAGRSRLFVPLSLTALSARGNMLSVHISRISASSEQKGALRRMPVHHGPHYGITTKLSVDGRMESGGQPERYKETRQMRDQAVRESTEPLLQA